jgi:O-antigen ligase
MSTSFSLTSTIIIFLGALASIIFFTEIYDEIYTILFIALALLSLTLIRLKKIIFTKKILKTLFLFLSLILYYSINVDNGIIKDIDYKITSKTRFNFFYSQIIFFCFFLIGYFYSLQVEYPLKILSKIFSLQLFCFFIYLLWISWDTEISNTDLSTGARIFIFLPFFLIAFSLNKKIALILVYIVALSYLFLISNRASMIVITMFFISYSIYPYLLKSRNLFKAYFFFNLFVIFILHNLYLEFVDSELLSEISLKVFDKALDTRSFLWIELIEIIKQKLLFGYGANQFSQYISYSGEFNRNNLSSHSVFFEILLSGGLFGLFLYLFLLYSIFVQFFCYRNNDWGRIGSSFLIGIIYSGTTSTKTILGNIPYNAMIWLFLATAVAQVIKINKRLI